MAVIRFILQLARPFTALYAVTCAISVCSAVAAEQAPGDVPLVGTYWRFAGFGDTPLSLADGDIRPHIAIHEDGARIAGFGGCNRFFASYTLDGDRIDITPLGGGRVVCPETSALESRFIATLAAVSSLSLVEHRLVLFNDTGDVLRFVAVPD